MEMNLLQRKKSLESKIPDISKTLEVVHFLIKKKVRSAKMGWFKSD